MKMYNSERMQTFAKRGGNIAKIVCCILLWVLALIGFFCSYLLIYETKTPPHIMGNDSTFLKAYYRYFTRDFEDKMTIGGVQPFADTALSGENVDIVSDATFSFPNTGEYNLTLHRSTMNDVVELRFLNASFGIVNFLFYNPDFTSLLDPYQYVDYLYYGLWRKPVYEAWSGDFCLVFSTSHVLSPAWTERFPDCHTIVIPKAADYPYTILHTVISPVDTASPASMEARYYTGDF